MLFAFDVLLAVFRLLFVLLLLIDVVTGVEIGVGVGGGCGFVHCGFACANIIAQDRVSTAKIVFIVVFSNGCHRSFSEAYYQFSHQAMALLGCT